jgi:glycosyltransferase involved in cell wall biosynthesis
MFTVDISVIIPSKVGENRLVTAIESVYDQHLNMEILVGIDGLDAVMRKKLESLPIKNLEIFESDEKIGTTKILNKLLTLAKGEYVARMDADDVSLPRRLEKQIAYMKNNREIAMMCSNAITTNGSLLFSHESKLLNYSDFFNDNPIIHPTVVFRKSDMEAGGYFYNSKWIKAQDFELWTRISRKHEIYFSSEPLLQYTKSFSLVGFSKQYFYFEIANFKNLVWHLFRSSSYPKYLSALQMLKVVLIPFDYLKIIIWNKLNAK